MKAPSVIIGVGGIGAEICANVAMMPENAARKNIRFVIMDTDVNSIRELHRKGFRGTEILLTDNITVGCCRDSMEGVEDWYPSSDIFNDKPMTEGAGQQRAISRLALEYSVREGKLTPLFDVIQELNELTMDESDQQMRFYIVSSLAGGTGSGLILPLSLQLKKFVFEECGDNRCICKGFFVLSSALRRSVGTRLEQKSLDSNAYAAVKELYAFMRTADSEQKRYSQTSMSLTGEDRQFQSSSYEYCYLFGIANERGKRMHSFEELKQLVAQAVNMQACSPIHDRNSSREDNTLKHVTYKMLEQGRDSLNRFGGIGCGELVYPYDMLKEYFAMRWASKVMDEKWLEYDKNFYSLRKQQKENRRMGKKVIPVSRGNEYINSVQLADYTDSFSESIRSCCMQEDGTENWDGYLRALEERVSQQVDEIRRKREADPMSADSDFADSLEEMLRPGYRPKEKMRFRNQTVRSYKQLQREIPSLEAQFGGYYETHFFELHPVTEAMEPFWMEYWLQKDGKFIHPNAVRYFLYRLQSVLEEKIQDTEGILKSENSKSGDDDFKQEFAKWTERLGNDYEVEKEEFCIGYEALYRSVKCQVYIKVLKRCRKYIEYLIRNYEDFYDSIEEMTNVFKERGEELAKELDRTSGVSKSYVCADVLCREKIFTEIKRRPEFFGTTDAISYKIYELIHNPVENRQQRRQRFVQMERYWEDALEENYSDMLDMNILHAMEKEEMCRTGRRMTGEEMANRIEQVRKILVEPFVQYYKMAGEEQGISICCYNSILEDEHGERLKAVRWLREHEGVGDETYCDARRVMFYRSFVGLDVGKVLEFLHWSRKSRFKGAGRAFRYYEQTLLDMGKAKDGRSQITPHLDKDWHSLLQIPDTDSSYQSQTEIEIGVAFLYGILGNWIKKAAGKYVIMLDNGNQGFTTLPEVHKYLYYNAQVRKQLSEKLDHDIDADNREGESKVLQMVKDYWGGIYRILLDYNKDLPLGLQDETVNGYLVVAVYKLVERCIQRDTKDVQGTIRAVLYEAWEKCGYIEDDGQKDTDNGRTHGRLDMIIMLIKRFLQGMKG